MKTNKSEAPFNTEAYANYKALVDKEREQIDTINLKEYIYQLGYKIDTVLSKIDEHEYLIYDCGDEIDFFEFSKSTPEGKKLSAKNLTSLILELDSRQKFCVPFLKAY